MDGFRIKGLQRILVNVDVYLDLNFQTTTVMVTNDFAPAIRGKQQMELGGDKKQQDRCICDVYKGIMQHKT